MQKACLFIGVLWALAHSLAAQQANPSASPSPMPTPALPAVSLQEAAGLSITRQWAEKSYEAMRPQPGPDGAIVFRYGEATPTISCAVLQVSDVELQPGEVVNEVEAGDSERWAIQAAVSGVVEAAAADPGDRAGQATQHVTIKPKEPNLQTSLIVTTDRRTYHLRLVSRESGYMELVRFVYKDEAAKAAAVPAPPTPDPTPVPGVPKARVAMVEPVRRKNPSPPREGKAVVLLGKASKVEDDHYRVSGSAPWRPQRVYTDGKKTYIELPENLEETPVLFRRKKGGFLGLGHQLQLVNGRYHGRWVIADAVLDDAVLQSGVGGAKEQVVISRVGAGK